MYRNGNVVYNGGTISTILSKSQLYFELSDHLGNVRVVVTGIKTSGNATIANLSDYYPFGMEMPGRQFANAAGEYRFGFNGMEKDDESKGNGNSYTTEFRQYDPRVGRWFSPDPLSSMFADQSPYDFVFNCPTGLIDPLGLSPNGGNPKYYDKAGFEIDENGKLLPGKSNFGSKLLSIGTVICQTSMKIERMGNNLSLQIGQINHDVKSPKWGSKHGVYIHQRANNMTISRWNLKRTQKLKGTMWQQMKESRKLHEEAMMIINKLNESTFYSDGDQFQNGESSYRHAMRDEGQSISDAKAKADAFVRDQFDKAMQLKSEGKLEDAIFKWGIGIHTLQDATSPAHGGFQQWTGEETLSEEVDHVSKEFMYPGPYSNLQKITDQAWEWFLNGKLPAGNLFDNIKVDE